MLAQLAGGALAAAVAPRVQFAAIPDIAGVRHGTDTLHKRRAAFLLGEGPCTGLVQPHQGGMHDETGVHAEVEGDLHGFDGVVAAVGIAGKIGFADAHHQMPDAFAPRQRGGGGEEHEVAARHKCIGDALLVERDFHVAGHGRFADLVEQAEAEQGVLAELGGPQCGQGGVRADGVQYVPAAFHFHMMPLSVVETDRKDAIETVEGPSEAGRGVLSAGKNDKGRRVCIAGHMLS